MAKKLRGTGTQATNVSAAEATTQGISLTGRACDQMAELSTVLEAYLGLERLISTDYLDEARAGVPVSRAGLGALLHILNDAMQRRIDAITDTMAVLLVQLAEGDGGGGSSGSVGSS